MQRNTPVITQRPNLREDSTRTGNLETLEQAATEDLPTPTTMVIRMPNYLLGRMF